VDDLINTLSHVPLATILVVSGIGFLLLSIAGTLAGKITVEPAKQKVAGVIGAALLVLGVVLLFYSPDTTPKSAQSQPPPAAPTPAQPPTPAPQPPQGVQPPPPPANRPPAVARPGPGVNCTGTGTPDEVAICGSATLSELDLRLYTLFETLLRRSSPDQIIKLKQEERVWVQQRGECRGNENCLAAAYKSRIDQLELLR
jgi:uncharacterized protein YecT (DUF1311 family)